MRFCGTKILLRNHNIAYFLYDFDTGEILKTGNRIGSLVKFFKPVYVSNTYVYII